MPRVSDFVFIRGDANRTIGDNGLTIWESNFNATTVSRSTRGVLMFMVRGLTLAEENVEVRINNQVIGQIFRYEGADSSYWFTQIIQVDTGVLVPEDNELEIRAIGYPGASAGDLFDDFVLI